MRTRGVLPGFLAAFALLLSASAARAVEHGAFGLGVNTSLSLAQTSPGINVAGLGQNSGTLSFRIWVSRNFAIDPQFGMGMVALDGKDAVVGLVIGSRFLFSAINASQLRFNVGGEFLTSFGTVGQAFFGLSFGGLAGVEYFFSSVRNLSFEVYMGLAFGMNLTPATNFGMQIGGNVIAGFHYYF